MFDWARYTVSNETVAIYDEISENLSITDAHTHIGLDKSGYKVTIKNLINELKKTEIDKCISFPLNDPFDKTFKRPNNLIWKAYKTYPKKIIPFFRLNPHSKWKEEFDRCAKMGFRGIKLHPASQDFSLSMPQIKEICKLAENERLPLIIHTGIGMENRSLSNQLAELAKEFKQIKIILGHSCFVDLENVVKLVSKKKNFVLDTSATSVVDLIEIFEKVDYKSIIFGSDYPYYFMNLSLECAVNTAIVSRLSVEKIRKILSENIWKWIK